MSDYCTLSTHSVLVLLLLGNTHFSQQVTHEIRSWSIESTYMRRSSCCMLCDYFWQQRGSEKQRSWVLSTVLFSGCRTTIPPAHVANLACLDKFVQHSSDLTVPDSVKLLLWNSQSFFWDLLFCLLDERHECSRVRVHVCTVNMKLQSVAIYLSLA